MPTTDYDSLLETVKLVLRPKDVCHALGISKATLWRLTKTPDFPKPIQMGPRAIAWHVEAIAEWAKNRPIADGEATRKQFEKGTEQ